ncbi:MAG: tripartite tricarboxylate transporter substrate binding protein [Xanthobacteraceae bacterium]|nr:tripartite tricarboxylate transporter substrate binding protein [Xanthobacteraceae bacterium]
MPLSIVRALAAVAAAFIAVTPAIAQQYPSQPIKIIVSLAPGGVADVVARAFAAKLGEQGKQVVVENRTGGGGIIGADAAAKSPSDGYTFYMGFHATQSILPHLNAKLPYDPAKDFLPVVFITTSPNILIVHPSVPANTPQELIAYIKANPGKLSYGSPGLGSSGHLAGEQFKQMNSLDILHVHYRGAAPALQDLVAGHVQVMFDIVPLTKEQLAAGRVRPLAITSARREPAVPTVPTFAELGMPGIEGGPWFGLFAPAGTPRAAIDWVNAEANKAFLSPDLKARLEGQGLTLPLGTPEAFGKHVTAETARWGEVIRKGNIKAE